MTSDLYKTVRIVLDRCNATSDADCVSDAVFAAREAYMGKFQVSIPTLGCNLNPESHDYRSYYL